MCQGAEGSQGQGILKSQEAEEESRGFPGEAARAALASGTRKLVLVLVFQDCHSTTTLIEIN